MPNPVQYLIDAYTQRRQLEHAEAQQIAQMAWQQALLEQKRQEIQQQAQRFPVELSTAEIQRDLLGLQKSRSEQILPYDVESAQLEALTKRRTYESMPTPEEESERRRLALEAARQQMELAQLEAQQREKEAAWRRAASTAATFLDALRGGIPMSQAAAIATYGMPPEEAEALRQGLYRAAPQVMGAETTAGAVNQALEALQYLSPVLATVSPGIAGAAASLPKATPEAFGAPPMHEVLGQTVSSPYQQSMAEWLRVKSAATQQTLPVLLKKYEADTARASAQAEYYRQRGHSEMETLELEKEKTALTRQVIAGRLALAHAELELARQRLNLEWARLRSGDERARQSLEAEARATLTKLGASTAQTLAKLKHDAYKSGTEDAFDEMMNTPEGLRLQRLATSPLLMLNQMLPKEPSNANPQNQQPAQRPLDVWNMLRQQTTGTPAPLRLNALPNTGSAPATRSQKATAAPRPLTLKVKEGSRLPDGTIVVTGPSGEVYRVRRVKPANPQPGTKGKSR